MRLFSLLFFAVSLVAFSCRTQKTVTNNYLYNVADTSGDAVKQFQYIIQKGDMLSIKVYSTALGVRPEIDEPYNLPTADAGFLVDNKGNIEYPQIGELHVEGLTREQVSDLVKSKLEGQLNKPSVIVRFLNYRITILGEVGGPGTFTVPTERITILEALGMAGDISEFGKKDNVKVIRETDGIREIGTIDLTSKEMFNSPFYHLKQNDVVMVDQTENKRKQEERQTLLQNIGLATTIMTAIALILNLIK